MNYFIALLSIAITIYSCDSSKTTIKKTGDSNIVENDTIRIANEELEYEIIIIEPGFDSWIITQPPKGYYGLSFLESRNYNFVSQFNQRVLNPQRYSTTLYPQSIDYQIDTKYGLEVNYLLYNYFVYFQQKYKQKFIGGR